VPNVLTTDNCTVLRALGIEDIASDQHMVGAVQARGFADGVDCVEARLGLDL
jgi:hypothetical protein